jgi:hypothetical protein
VNGKRHGKGTYTYKSGSKYEGDWEDGRKSGQGKFEYLQKDGSAFYEGQWMADQRHGRGVYTYPNGDKYDGQWQNGARHGDGTYTFAADGTVLKGRWAEGKFSGNGRWILPNGTQYVGGWKEGVPSGPGAFAFPHGSIQYGVFSAVTVEDKDQKKVVWQGRKFEKGDASMLM